MIGGESEAEFASDGGREGGREGTYLEEEEQGGKGTCCPVCTRVL